MFFFLRIVYSCELLDKRAQWRRLPGRTISLAFFSPFKRTARVHGPFLDNRRALLSHIFPTTTNDNDSTVETKIVYCQTAATVARVRSAHTSRRVNGGRGLKK